MKTARLLIMLLGACGLSLLTGCASHQHPAGDGRGPEPLHAVTISDRDYNPLAQNFDREPPFGSRGNLSYD